MTKAELLKRGFDIIIGLALAVVVTPLIILLAVGSCVSFRAWPFFTQWRLGKDQRPFRFIKIRSLPPSTERHADKYALESVQNTRFGRFLRRTHLDELPQLWLVVIGRMSLVGPRPEMPALAARFDRKFVELRCQVRPGCTGLWQLSDGKHKLIGEAPKYDVYYVGHRTTRLDCWVLARTVLALFGLCRPIDLRSVPRWTQKRELEFSGVLTTIETTPHHVMDEAAKAS